MADLKYELAKQEELNSNDCSKSEIENRQPRKRLTAKQKTCAMIIIAVLLFILFLFLIGLIVLGVQVSKAKRELREMIAETPCTSVECINTVSDVMRSVDRSVDPCKDFYSYACGKWEKNNPIPEPYETWAPLNKLRAQNEKTVQRLIKRTDTRLQYSKNKALRKVFTYYDACMNQNAINNAGKQPMLDLIQKLGSCEAFDSSWNETTWSLVDIVSKVHAEFPTRIFFSMWIGVMEKNTTVGTIFMSTRVTGLKTSRYNSTKSEDVKIKKAYKTYLVSLLQLLGLSKNKSVEMMESIFSVEFDLTTMMTENRDGKTKTTTIKDMDKDNQQGRMNWTVFFEKLFENSKYKPSGNTPITLYDPGYMTKVQEYFNTEPKRDLANYVVWRLIDRFSNLLPKSFQKPWDEYVKVFNTNGQSSPEIPRWEKCVSEVRSNFGMAIGRMFADEVFRNGSKGEVTELVQDIKKIFIEDFDNVDWMDEETKIVAKEKAEMMHANIGYPNFIMDDEKLADLYKEYHFENNTYFKNVLAVEKIESIEQMNQMQESLDRKGWVISPNTINAVYAAQMNSMDIPAGILQKPLYHNTFPGSVNFGGIGAIIGHEMTHGFDTTGKQYNHKGHGQKWWSNSSLQNFDEKAECFVNQYSNFTYMGMQLDGKVVLGEVIADNGGTEIAFKAYKLWVKEHGTERQLPGVKLSHEQFFFIAYAQIFCGAYTEYGAKMSMNRYHPINPLRVRGVVINSKEFAKAYKCPVGSPMNPAKKCKIW